mgnify:CR=1 FL=1
MTWPSATDPLLLEAASTQRVDEFAATVRVWKADADRDLDGRRRAALQHTWRKACWHTGPDGMVHVRVDLAPDAGAIVTGALHTISERLWRDEDDRRPHPSDPARGRNVQQRNADAFVEVARYANAGTDVGRARVDVLAVVDHMAQFGSQFSQVTKLPIHFA